MICHLKYIFMWIFLIPQPTGNVFNWDFAPIFFSVYFLLSYQNSIDSSYNLLYLGDFKLTVAV